MSLRRAIVLTLGSTLLHVAAGAGGLLLAARMEALAPIVVDLSQPEPAAGVATPPSGPPAPSRRAGPARRPEPARERAVAVASPEAAARPSAAPEAPAPPPVEPRKEATALARSPGEARGPARAPAAEGPPGPDTGPAGSDSSPAGALVAASGARLALAAPGDGRGGVRAEYGAYLARFRERVQQTLSYPLSARRRGLSGSVELEVVIDERGAVRDVRVVSSSAHPVLDEAAVETLRRVEPVPFPANVPSRRLTVRLPLVFDLK